LSGFCECTSSCIMFLALSCPKYSAFPRIKETSYPQVSPSCKSVKMACEGLYSFRILEHGHA
jgi:hypothetical protein